MTLSHLSASERERAALRESEGRFRQIADSAPVPMWVTQLDRTRSFVNRAYLDFLGVPYDDALAFDWRTILHPADHDRVVAESIAGEASLKPFALEARYRRGDGEWRWLRSESQPRFGPEGEHIGFIGVAHDVTVARAAEEGLRLSEARMRLALEAGGITDWYWDRATNRVRFSDHARRVHRLADDIAVSGEDLMAMVVEEDRSRSQAASDRAIATGEPYQIEHRVRGPDGKIEWVANYSRPVVENGEVVGIIGMTQVITPRKLDEQALKEREAQLSAFVNQTTAGFAQVDLDGRFTLVNDRFCEIAGRTREDLHSQTLQSITHPDDWPRNKAMFDAAVAEGTPYTHEKRYVRPDGSLVWVNNSVAVIRRPSGEPYGVLAICIDVSERRDVEQARRQAAESVRLAVEGAGMATWELDLDTMKGVWSANRFDMLGLPRDPTGQGSYEAWLERVHPDDRALARNATERCFTKGEPYTIEYRIVRADTGAERWLQSYGGLVSSGPDARARFVGVSFDITDRKRADEHQRLLINELNHRVKNTLAVVQGIARQTFADQGDAHATRAFEGRLVALAAAHNLLTEQNWEAASLAALIEAAAAPCLADAPRMTLSGADIRVSPKRAVALSLAVHELCTNAVKYGALSNETGRIEVDWNRDGDTVMLTWRERGGPPVQTPERRGFGSRMLERALASELQGEVALDFARKGLVCRIEFKIGD